MAAFLILWNVRFLAASTTAAAPAPPGAPRPRSPAYPPPRCRRPRGRCRPAAGWPAGQQRPHVGVVLRLQVRVVRGVQLEVLVLRAEGAAVAAAAAFASLEPTPTAAVAAVVAAVATVAPIAAAVAIEEAAIPHAPVGLRLGLEGSARHQASLLFNSVFQTRSTSPPLLSTVQFKQMFHCRGNENTCYDVDPPQTLY